MRTAIVFFTTALLATGLLLSGCSSAPKTDEKTAASKAPMKEYALKGEITGLDPAQHVATIKHEAVEGFMGAMTMGYPVKDPAEFSKIAVGDAVTATVYVSGDDMYVGNFQKVPKDAAAPAKK
jgi:Cu/Ag efflux protein CusF